MDPQLRPFSALQAEGWTSYDLRRAVAADELVRLTRSVYAPVVQLSPRELHLRRAAALLSTHRDSVVLSHASAAIAHGLAVQHDNPPLVDLTTPPPGRGRRTPAYHLRCARLEPDEVVSVGELRVTSLARTVADLARTTPFTWGVIVADQALSAGTTRLELSAAVEASSPAAGMARARQVVLFADARSESVAESASRVTIARTGLPRPVPQVPIEVDGRIIARGDFGWEDWKLIGEMDGEVKYRPGDDPDTTPEAVMAAQNRRQERIRQAGYWVTRWGWSQAWDVGAMRHLLRTALEQQGWRP